MKLISMVDFVLEEERKMNGQRIALFEGIFTGRVIRYANFLNQPLTLGMFVPCDEEGNVFNDFDDETYQMVKYKGSKVFAKDMIDLAEQYQQAKERVLFEGFDKCTKQSELPFPLDFAIVNGQTIEKLTEVYEASHLDLNSGLTLTPNTIKQIGL